MKTRMIAAAGILSITMFAAAPSVWSQEAPSPPAPSAPVSSAPTATPATASPAPPAEKKDERTSYIVLKTGPWSLKSDSLSGENSNFYGEIAFGGKFNPFFGAEFSVGRFDAEANYGADRADVSTIPVLLSLRLGVPIAIVEPYVLFGGGAYFTTIDVGSRSASTVAGGYHVGLGVDVALGPVLVGIESRYFSTVGQTFDADISLDGYTYAVKAGVRF
jgi:hypothetical protein